MRVLVIRLGALGDMFLSFPAFAAIRAHHAGDRIALLTTAPFAALAAASPWFDEVRLDARPRRLDLLGRRRLARLLRPFDLVYDLQTSRRSSSYFVLAGRPPWSGIAPGCRYPDDDPARDTRHTIDRQAGQLRRAGVLEAPPVALDWLLAGPPPAAAPAAPYAVLVPGAAPHRPAKRWPPAGFRAVAAALAASGLRPVVAGGAGDRALGAEITAGIAGATDLTGRTDLPGLARLLAGARLAIGNDTGPLHVAAAVGCPAVVLFSHESDPALTAPRGPAPVEVLRVPDLRTLPAGPVIDAALQLRARPARENA